MYGSRPSYGGGYGGGRGYGGRGGVPIVLGNFYGASYGNGMSNVGYAGYPTPNRRNYVAPGATVYAGVSENPDEDETPVTTAPITSGGYSRGEAIPVIPAGAGYLTRHQVLGWLSEIGMQRYSKQFAEHDIGGLALLELEDEDLEQMGVEKIGHKKRILKAIDFEKMMKEVRDAKTQFQLAVRRGR